MNMLKKFKFLLFFLFCIFLSVAVFGSKFGLGDFIVIDDGLFKTRLYNILAHLGLFSVFLAIYSLIKEKETTDKNWIFAAVFIIVLVAIQLGYHVSCSNSIYKYCRNFPADSEYAICHDKGSDYAC